MPDGCSRKSRHQRGWSTKGLIVGLIGLQGFGYFLSEMGVTQRYEKGEQDLS